MGRTEMVQGQHEDENENQLGKQRNMPQNHKILARYGNEILILDQTFTAQQPLSPIHNMQKVEAFHYIYIDNTLPILIRRSI